MSAPQRFRKFLLKVTPQLSTMVFLASLNWVIGMFTGATFPWAIFPILGMSISVIQTFSRIMLGDENEVAAALAERDRDRGRNRDRGRDETAQPFVTASRPMAEGLAAQLAQARTYQKAVNDLARGAPGGRLTELSAQFDAWVKSVEQMSGRIQGYKENPVIQQDLSSVPTSIKRLEGQLASETDARVRAQLEAALESRRNQLGALEKLGGTMRQAELQLENTVAALGTIYSQALAGQSTNQVAGYADLAGDMNERVRVLQDQIEALEEVKIGRAGANLAG
ncbi:MAG TPA: hypothetical protein PLG23_15245 [Thermoflexales bacterium]|nr:hypothetical protein [Thermoflexales bacterium]HQX12055.1 hypothetical protein [Thermoflexales bacterium]HQY26550.1 hypothetical protein [Thermoflexales bacterium]HQZ54819.1 hypothetical protein [Thermoflexales bacterium]